MQRKKVISHHHIIWSVIFSIGLHASLIVLSLYFFTQNYPILPRTNSAPLVVTMVNNSTFITVPQGVTTGLEKRQREKVKTISSALKNVSKRQHLAKSVQQALKPRLTETKIKKSETIQTTPLMNDSASNALISKVGSEQPLTASTTLKMPSLSAEPRALIKTNPIYPARAQALGIEGKVKIQYDIDPNGYVINLRILEATPRHIFEREVKKAVKMWRYEAIAVKDYVTVIVFKIPTSSVKIQ